MQCNRGLVQVCESYNGKLLLINFIQNAQIRLVCSKQFKSFVVGYQTKTTVAGFNFMAPSFEMINGGDIPLQSIVLSGDMVTPLEDNIQILDEGGATRKVYVWDDGSLAGEGWVDMDTMEVTSDSIKPGMGILVNTANESVSLTFAGAVGKEDIVINSVSGFNFVGNATPVEIAVQDIVISGDNVTPLEDNIQILDEGGATKNVYIWDDGSLAGEGWVDMDTMEVTTAKINAGDGFLVDTANANVVITIPSAL